MVTVQIITPPVADESGALDNMLVNITKAVASLDEDAVARGLLGGEFGYGADYENEVFLMHHFCWCERDDCRWCSEDACGCPHPGPRYYADGVEVDGDEYWNINCEIVGPMPHDVAEWDTPEYKAAARQFDKNIEERNKRLTTVYSARIHTCSPKGMMADRAEGESYEPNQCAPNFWHKPTGLKVWWYKWIGRDMEVVDLPDDLEAVARECLASIAP